MHTIDIDVAKRVISAREGAGLNKTELAEKLGMSKQAYQPYETFRTAFTVAQLHTVAKVTGIPLASLLGQPASTPKMEPDEAEILAAFRRITSAELRQMAIRLVRSIASAPSAVASNL